MPVLGVVLLLDDESEATRRFVAEQLVRFSKGKEGSGNGGGLELGAVMAHRWPAVLETATPEEAEARVSDLRAISGVAGVDVVYADFEDLLMRASARGASEGL